MTEQTRVNEAVWSGGDFVAAYANRSLSPAEITLLIRYRDAFAGRTLELGCGAGRITGYIIDLGGTVLGIDIAPQMVEHCRRTYPRGTFRVQDLRRLDGFETGSYDVVLAANNLLDVLDDGERRRVLAEIGRMLAQGGLLVMSSHNRAHASRIPSPLRAIGGGRLRALRQLPRVPGWLLNRRRLRSHQHAEAEYSVLIDEAHGYRLLHYYIDRNTQERQLEAAGLRLVECLDGNGRTVPADEDAAEHSELYYVARR